MCVTLIIRRETMQKEEQLWRGLSTTVMSADFEGRYQHQGFNPQFLASLDHDPVSSNRVSI